MVQIEVPIQGIPRLLGKPSKEERRRSTELESKITISHHDINERLTNLLDPDPQLANDRNKLSSDLADKTNEAIGDIKVLIFHYKKCLDSDRNKSYAILLRFFEKLHGLLRSKGYSENSRSILVDFSDACKHIESTFISHSPTHHEKPSTSPTLRQIIEFILLLSIILVAAPLGWIFMFSLMARNKELPKIDIPVFGTDTCQLNAPTAQDVDGWRTRILTDNHEVFAQLGDRKPVIPYLQRSQAEISRDNKSLPQNRPLSNIMNNNLLMKELSTKYNAPLYTIAVAVPLKNELKGETTGPHPYSLGILRGVDLAQKTLIEKYKRESSRKGVFLKVLVVDDMNITNDEQQSFFKWLADIQGDHEQIVGLLGHNSSNVTKLHAPCYDKYELPVLSISTADELYGKNRYVHHLAPSTKQIAKILVDTIVDKRTLKNHGKLEQVSVFFDPEDLGSTSLKDQICFFLSKTNDLPECKEVKVNVDVSHDKDSLFSKTLSSYQGKNDSEWIIAINPNITPNAERQILEIISDRNRTNIDINYQGVIYVGHEFIDQSLEERIAKQLNNQRSFDVIRISPWDWRLNDKKKSHSPFFHTSNQRIYGPNLNWYVLSSYNGIMAFHELISRGSNLANPSKKAEILRIRQKINNLLLNQPVSIKSAAPDVLQFNPQGASSFISGGEGFKLCAISILAENISNPDCEVP